MISFEERGDDQRSKLIQKGFFIERETRPITLDTEPRDGFEFIYKSRLEDANLQFSRNKTKDESPRPITPTSAMKRWGRKEAEKFCHLVKKLRSKREELMKKFPKVVEFPEQQDEKEWCEFCYGSKFCSEIYGEELPKVVKKGHQPLLSIVLHIGQHQINNLISYHLKWFVMAGMDDNMGRWLYALFGNLLKPVNEVHQTKLEDFHDYCETSLECLEDSNKDRVYLIMSILKHYFCVKYYTNGPSLSQLAMMPESDSTESDSTTSE